MISGMSFREAIDKYLVPDLEKSFKELWTDEAAEKFMCEFNKLDDEGLERFKNDLSKNITSFLLGIQRR